MRFFVLAPLLLSLVSCAGAQPRSPASAAAGPRPEAAFAEFTPPAPIPELIQLKQDETVPPQVYQKYSAKQVALTVVYKKYVEDEKAASEGVESPNYDYFRNGDIQLAFSETIIDSVAAKGFLNTFQVHRDCGMYAKGRVDSERKFLGYALEDACPPEESIEVRPKSAFFSLRTGNPDEHPLNATGEFAPKNGLRLGYGNVLAVFNDDVKNRTTFTMGDSSAAGTRTNVRTLWFKSEKFPPLLAFNDYLEAQVWGPLAISDVNHFIVNCSEKDERDLWGKPTGRITAEGLKHLKALGLPVFSCVKEFASSGRLIRVREGERL